MNFLQERFWAIDASFANRAIDLLQAGKIGMFQNKAKATVSTQQTESAGFFGLGKTTKNIAIVPIIGATTPYGDMCTIGYNDYESILLRVANDDKVDGVVFQMDTPGGAVTGLARLANIIASFPKPIIAHVAGQCCSAGMYLASQMDGIVVADGNASTLGSIGVLQLLVDQSKALNTAGIKVIIQRASKSFNKAKLNGYEPITDELLATEQAVLDAIETDFHNVMIAGRPKMKKAVLNEGATTYTGFEAVANGLADGIGSLEDAMAMAGSTKLARKKSEKNKSAISKPADNQLANNNLQTTKPKQMSKLLSSFVLLAAVLGTEHDPEMELGPLADTIEAKLADDAQKITSLTDAVAKAANEHKATADLLEASKLANTDLTDKLAKIEADAKTATDRAAELELFFKNQKDALNGAGADAGDLGVVKGDQKPAVANTVAELKAKYPSLLSD